MEDKADLIDRIEILTLTTERSIAQLQDFHVFTGHSYDRYAKMVDAGHIHESIYNTRTHMSVASHDLAHILLGYLDNDLPRVILYQCIAHFETFLFDLLEILIGQNVRRMRRREITAILETSPINPFLVISSDMKPLKPPAQNASGWLEFLQQTMGLEIPATDLLRLGELTATRHAWIHAAGMADSSYLYVAGAAARVEAGEFLPVSRPYVYDGSDFLRRLVRDIASTTLTRLRSAT